MKNILLLAVLLAAIFQLKAAPKDSSIVYQLADSVKAAGLYAEVQPRPFNQKKGFAGIQASSVRLQLDAHKNRRNFIMEIPAGAKVLATGQNVQVKRNELRWPYNWQNDATYRLLITSAADSAGNFTIYSGYAFLPALQKWKLIGTIQQPGTASTLAAVSTYSFITPNKASSSSFASVMVQRLNGSWKSLGASATPPNINYFSHIDSAQQAIADKAFVNDAMTAGKLEQATELEGIYYTILNKGNGVAVKVSDTLEVFYKGSLLSDGSIFDQTKEKPARFPLNRLIKGWQLALPLVNVGGKIRIIIPSGLAYSIRTRSPKIPPNSILVFEVEVVSSKPAI